MATPLTLRILSNSGDSTKNSPLTNSEVDNNFIALDNNKVDKAGDTITGDLVVTGSTSSNHAASTSGTLTTSSTAQVAVDTFAASVYRSAKYFAQIVSGSAYHVTELNVVHNGTTAYVVEYGENKTGAVLGSFNADISGVDVRLLFTAVNAVTTVKVNRLAIFS